MVNGVCCFIALVLHSNPDVTDIGERICSIFVVVVSISLAFASVEIHMRMQIAVYSM